MKLTPRLEKIASLIKSGGLICDIGSDHGYIPVYLLEKNLVKKAIISDVNKGPLKNAKDKVDSRKLQDRAILRLGSGLEVIDMDEADKIDEVIIAGMGGILISEILNKDMKKTKKISKFILQPMQASDELRKFLLSKGFDIVKEHLVKEDFRIYEILEVVYNPIKHEFSNELIENYQDLCLELIEKKIYEYKKIMKNIEKLENKDAREKSEVLKEKINAYEKIMLKYR